MITAEVLDMKFHSVRKYAVLVFGVAASLITCQIFLGGVVVFAVNSLLYLNQSVPPYGVSLNSQTAGTTAFPLRKRYHLKTLLYLCL